MIKDKFSVKILLVLFMLALIAVTGCSKKGNERDVTIKSPSGEVKIEKKGEEIKVTDSKYGIEISGKTGVDPSELSLKIYPNAQPDSTAGNMKVEVPQGTLINAFFIANDNPNKVIDFYSKEVKNAYKANGSNGTTVIGKTSTGNDVTVVISKKESGTKIYVQEMKPKK